jgi:hypothetical protein
VSLVLPRTSGLSSEDRRFWRNRADAPPGIEGSRHSKLPLRDEHPGLATASVLLVRQKWLLSETGRLSARRSPFLRRTSCFIRRKAHGRWRRARARRREIRSPSRHPTLIDQKPVLSRAHPVPVEEEPALLRAQETLYRTSRLSSERRPLSAFKGRSDPEQGAFYRRAVPVPRVKRALLTEQPVLSNEKLIRV